MEIQSTEYNQVIEGLRMQLTLQRRMNAENTDRRAKLIAENDNLLAENSRLSSELRTVRELLDRSMLILDEVGNRKPYKS